MSRTNLLSSSLFCCDARVQVMNYWFPPPHLPSSWKEECISSSRPPVHVSPTCWTKKWSSAKTTPRHPWLKTLKLVSGQGLKTFTKHRLNTHTYTRTHPHTTLSLSQESYVWDILSIKILAGGLILWWYLLSREDFQLNDKVSERLAVLCPRLRMFVRVDILAFACCEPYRELPSRAASSFLVDLHLLHADLIPSSISLRFLKFFFFFFLKKPSLPPSSSSSPSPPSRVLQRPR